VNDLTAAKAGGPVPAMPLSPDPTILTREASDRAKESADKVDTLRDEAMQRELALRQTMREHETQSLRELLDVRLAAMDKATDLRLAAINAIPELIAAAVTHLENLMDERLSSVDLRFTERDTRTSQAAETSQKALDAALLAAAALVNQQNEANATAATVQTLSFTKQIDQIIVLTERQQKSSDDRLAELKERIDRGDGSSAGVRVATTDRQSNNNLIIAVVTAVLFVVSVGVSVVAIILR
jgi:hypothetical protein